jgi:hypothetical protein
VRWSTTLIPRPDWFRNRQVIGSSPIVGSSFSSTSTTSEAPTARFVTKNLWSLAVEGVQPVLVRSREPVCVPLERRGGFRVTELCGNVSDRRVLREQLGRGCVPEVVEPKAAELCLLENPAPGLTIVRVGGLVVRP